MLTITQGEKVFPRVAIVSLLGNTKIHHLNLIYTDRSGPISSSPSSSTVKAAFNFKYSSCSRFSSSSFLSCSCFAYLTKMNIQNPSMKISYTIIKNSLTV